MAISQIVYRYMTEQGIIPTLNSCSLRFANVQDLNDTYEFPFISENLRKSEVNILVHKFRNEGLSSIGKKIFSKCNDNIDSVIDEITNFSRKILEEQYDKTVEFTKKIMLFAVFLRLLIILPYGDTMRGILLVLLLGLVLIWQ